MKSFNAAFTSQYLTLNRFIYSFYSCSLGVHVVIFTVRFYAERGIARASRLSVRPSVCL